MFSEELNTTLSIQLSFNETTIGRKLSPSFTCDLTLHLSSYHLTSYEDPDGIRYASNGCELVAHRCWLSGKPSKSQPLHFALFLPFPPSCKAIKSFQLLFLNLDLQTNSGLTGWSNSVFPCMGSTAATQRSIIYRVVSVDILMLRLIRTSICK